MSEPVKIDGWVLILAFLIVLCLFLLLFTGKGEKDDAHELAKPWERRRREAYPWR